MIRHFKARPRLFTSFITGCVLWLLLGEVVHHVATRMLVSWDMAVGLYLLLVWRMIEQSDAVTIKKRAATQDEGQFAVLALCTITAVTSLAAIMMEFSHARELSGLAKGEHIALAGFTVLLSWTFMHTIFALHYAHEFYITRKGKCIEGLEFPGNDHVPDYWDFIYFSFVIGTAAATADINITSPGLRKISTLHCMIAFFFNTTILALTINISAGLF
jgi:uncharacterized membrane protein